MSRWRCGLCYSQSGSSAAHDEGSLVSMPPRRYPSPWSIEENPECFIMRDVLHEIVRPLRCVEALSLALVLAIGNPAIAGPRAGALARCQAIRDAVQRRDCFRSLNGKIMAVPPVPFVQDRGADNPEITSAINHLSAVGQPLCVDRDALAAMLMARNVHMSTCSPRTNSDGVMNMSPVSSSGRQPLALTFAATESEHLASATTGHSVHNADLAWVIAGSFP